LPAEFAGGAERYILGAATANGRSPADTTWNRLPGAVGPGFRPSVGASLIGGVTSSTFPPIPSRRDASSAVGP